MGLNRGNKRFWTFTFSYAMREKSNAVEPMRGVAVRYAGDSWHARHLAAFTLSLLARRSPDGRVRLGGLVRVIFGRTGFRACLVAA